MATDGSRAILGFRSCTYERRRHRRRRSVRDRAVPREFELASGWEAARARAVRPRGTGASTARVRVRVRVRVRLRVRVSGNVTRRTHASSCGSYCNS
jgi:hypothetical protein